MITGSVIYFFSATVKTINRTAELPIKTRVCSALMIYTKYSASYDRRRGVALANELSGDCWHGVVFSQNFGASVLILLGQTTPENSLLDALGDIGNGIDAQKVTDAGAMDFSVRCAPTTMS